MENGDVELRRQNIIGHTVQLLLDCEEKGRIRKLQPQPSIRMVPNALRAQSPYSFNPRVVSIGPLHKEDKILQEFEDEKAIYLHEFLCRIDVLPEQTLQACVQKVSDSIDKIKACYAGMMKFDDTELAKMMVMDGCFILHFCYKVLVGDRSLFNTGVKARYNLNTDLLLVENQIPYFVLEDIFQYTILKFEPRLSLTDLIRPVLKMFTFLGRENLSDFRLVDTCDDHILGLLHKSNRLAFENLPRRSSKLPTFHSVRELDRAGVSFKPNKDATSPMAMKLEFSKFSVWHPWSWGKPILSMPVIRIQDKAEIVLRNLIAYEDSVSSVPNYVTSYAYAMQMLIDTPEDIARLVESKIIDSVFTNDRAVNMLKAVSKGAIILDFFYHNELQQLHKYYNSYWPKQIAGLKRTYFSNPWSMIALFAGIVLFLLTLIQTIFTVKSTIK